MNSKNLGTIYSENFKKWFGDWENDPQNASKVVDSNGMPLPVYHGTVCKGKDGLPFKKFKTESNAGDGVMFADNYSVASFFGGHGQARFGNFEEKFAQWPHKDSMDGLVEFLNNVLKNGKYSIRNFNGVYNGEPYEFYRLDCEYYGGGSGSTPLGDTEEEALETLRHEVEKEIRYMERDSKQGYTGGVYNVYLNIRSPYIFDAQGSQFHMLRTQFHQKRLTVFELVYFVKQTGKYDGVIVKNVRETTMGNGILTTDYIVFKPNQIKHALDNNGNYSLDTDDMTEAKIHEAIKEVLTEALITEGVETKNMKLAKHYLYQKKGFNEQQAMQCIGQIKTDIPNSRLGKCKFMLAMVRMFCDGDFNDGATIMKVNKSLKFAASDAHINEYNNDLNGFSAQQLIDKFAVSAQQDLDQDRNDVSSQEYNESNNHYEIVKITSFEEAEEYGDYVSWCVTHYDDMYDSYTSNGNGVFYFCLRDGWQNEPEEPGEGCPLDSYGLSMIAVSVNSDGSCNTITCRWNHDNGGNDNIMTTKQLSEVIGRNFYDVFKPLTMEEIQENQQRILMDIADEVSAIDIEYDAEKLEFDPDYGDTIEADVYVYKSEKDASAIIGEEGEFIIDMVFDSVNYRVGDTMAVYLGKKSNFVTLYYSEGYIVKGKLVSDTWFDQAHNEFNDGYGMVRLNNKWNLIDKNGQYLLKDWHDAIGRRRLKDSYIEVVDNGKTNFINMETNEYLFDRPVVYIFFADKYGTFIRLEGDDYIQVYDPKTLKLRAPWKIQRLLGYHYTYFYCVELTNDERYLIDDKGNLYDHNSKELVYQNPMINTSANESISRKYIDEVRYIDTRDEKYNGAVHKKHWTEIYNQEPITDDSRIRVFHGCELKTACNIAINGTSGKTYHTRQYSYEAGMNPLGIFVTTDFETAKKFGVSNSGMAIIEFTAKGSDLETPVWNGQGSYFGQGSNPMPFSNSDERDAQKKQYRQDALNTPDDYYYDDKHQKRDISMSHVRNSDKPEMADRIFNNTEHQALFVGDLNPNMIKRIWVKLPREDGYVHSDDNYQPMSVREFIKKFKDKEWCEGTDYKGNWKYSKIRKEKLFYPNEDVKSFDDVIDRIWENEKNYYNSREEVKQSLESFGMLQNPPSDNAYDLIKNELWPKQIIQLYGKEYFKNNFDRLGQWIH